MSTAEVQRPTQPLEAVNALAPLQATLDTHFSGRAMRVGSRRIARFGLRAHSLRDRPQDDLTRLENDFLEADPTRTGESLEEFLGRISNVEACLETFNQQIVEHNLGAVDARGVIAFPHEQLIDEAIGRQLFAATEVGKSTPVTNHTAWVSKQIPYADIQILPVVGRRQGSLQRNVQPFANSAIAIPDSETMSGIRAVEDYRLPIERLNAELARKVFRGHKQAEGPIIDSCVPSQSQYKRKGLGKGFIGTTDGSLRLAELYLRRGFTMLFMGAHANPVKLHLPKWLVGNQEVAIAFAEPIFPDASYVKKPEILRAEMDRRLLEVARKVSPVAIYS